MSIAPSERARALVEALHDPCSNEDRWEIVQRYLTEAEATVGRQVLQDAIHLVRTVAVGEDGSRLTLREQIEEQLRALLQPAPSGRAISDATGVPVELDDEDLQ